jgi:hypothetical protein
MTAQEEEFPESRAADVFEATQVKDHPFGALGFDLFTDDITDVLMMGGIKTTVEDDDKDGSCFFEMDIHGR